MKQKLETIAEDAVVEIIAENLLVCTRVEKRKDATDTYAIFVEIPQKY